MVEGAEGRNGTGIRSNPTGIPSSTGRIHGLLVSIFLLHSLHPMSFASILALLVTYINVTKVLLSSPLVRCGIRGRKEKFGRKRRQERSWIASNWRMAPTTMYTPPWISEGGRPLPLGTFSPSTKSPVPHPSRSNRKQIGRMCVMES